MQNRFSRRASAFVLAFSLLGGSVLAPASALAQDDKQTAQTKSDKKDKKADKKKSEQVAQQQTAATGNRRPLSPNEDPAMIGKRNINKGFGGWLGGSQQKEVAIGRQYAAEVEKELKLVEDPLVTEYINRVGQNIVNHSDAKVPFTIKVVDSDEVNAFALPGGFFYVNKGLLLAADNESELAGVMAHEIAHVAARHAMENQGKNQLIQYGMLAGIIFGGGIASTVLQNGGGILSGLLGLKFNRGSEEEADRLGVQYLYAAGYDPTGMATMFEKLAAKNKKKPGTIVKLFSTHPQPEGRRDATLALVSRFPENEEYVISTSEFQRVKNHLLRLSNAKSTVAGDIDEGGDPGRPTLKKRQPVPDDTTTTSPTSDSDKDNQKPEGPPVLKKRGEQPTPSPSPNR